jgi:transcriptional regulator with XRE-family HTH domain
MGKGQLKNEELLHKIVVQIKLLREERSLTQEDVYNDIGIHIARIETGKYNVSISTLLAIVQYFGLSLQQFFKEIDS